MSRREPAVTDEPRPLTHLRAALRLHQRALGLLHSADAETDRLQAATAKARQAAAAQRSQADEHLEEARGALGGARQALTDVRLAYLLQEVRPPAAPAEPPQIPQELARCSAAAREAAEGIQQSTDTLRALRALRKDTRDNALTWAVICGAFTVAFAALGLDLADTPGVTAGSNCFLAVSALVAAASFLVCVLTVVRNR